MSNNTIFCAEHACNRLALFHCASCGRALCARHAIRLRLFGGNSMICSTCRRRKFTDPKRRLSSLH
jgi:hypothetical protein